MLVAFMEYLKTPVNLKAKKTLAVIMATILLLFAIPLTVYVSLQHKNLKTQAAPEAMPALPAHWTGVNVWSIAADENLYDCGGRPATHQQTVDDTFQHLHDAGASVVRFFAFQPYAVNSSGQRDWTAMDMVFASAQAHGIYLIPVLGNNWNDCDYWPLSLNSYSSSWPQPWYNGFYHPKNSVAIKSSSNAADGSGIIIETVSPHGFGNGVGTGGWQITVEGHERSQANGKQWDVTIIDATHFKLTRKWPENTAPTPLSAPGGQSGIAYSVGYQDPRNGLPASYRGWVNEIVTRYSQNPTLLAWEVINEPRENGTILNNFFRDIISVIQSADPTTPVSLGCICHGESGFSGADMSTQYALPGVGFVTAHDYSPDGSAHNEPMPSYIQNDINVANQLGKPFFVGEMGRDGAFDQAKIDMYKAKMQAAFDAGAVGYLLWAYTDDQPAGSSGYDFGVASPLMAILNDFAGPGDTENPNVSITLPTSGTPLSGTATIQGTADDNVGVTKVEFFDGSTKIGETTTPTSDSTYSITWDTTKVSNGSHLLTAKAYDATGNIGTSSTVTVIVNNTSPPATKTGDLNGDTHVNATDLGILVNNWGPTSAAANTSADINNDGSINIFDLSILLTNWGT